MDEYLTKINRLLDHAADQLDADDFDELLEELTNEITDRADIGYGSDDGNEEDE